MSKGFTEYEHMENHYNLEKICDVAKLNPDVSFVCTEKIHGTNYSFLYNGSDDVIPCKRGSSLGNDRSFMGHGFVYEKYAKDVKVIFEYLKEKYYEDLVQIQLYGELFGGCYNGKTTKGHKKVQKGVNYHCDNEFMAYDLKIQTADKTFYFDYNLLDKMFTDLKDVITIKHVPVMVVGKYDEVIKLNPTFESVVYSHYGLDKIENNYAEGYVIRPTTEMTMPKHSEGEYEDQRMIFKLKNPSFSEVEVESAPLESKSAKPVKPNYADMLKRYLTDMRYDNVKSKLTDDEQDKLKDMLFNDVLTDFTIDNTIDEKTLELCKKQLSGLITGFLKKKELTE